MSGNSNIALIAGISTVQMPDTIGCTAIRQSCTEVLTQRLSVEIIGNGRKCAEPEYQDSAGISYSRRKEAAVSESVRAAEDQRQAD